ncbi:MAG: DUF4054 domain-containing protein [Weissella confusa]
MAYVFDANEAAANAKLLSLSFSDFPDTNAVAMAKMAWNMVSEASLPDKFVEQGVSLYTAHLMYQALVGGISAQSTTATTKTVKDLSITTGGKSVSYAVGKESDPYYADWLDLVKRYGRNYGVGLVVVR